MTSSRCSHSTMTRYPKAFTGTDMHRERHLAAHRHFSSATGNLRGFGTWALEEKASKSFAGHAGLWFPEGWDDVEVGYGIAPEHRRKGYAAEAARRARDYGYEIGIARARQLHPANQRGIDRGGRAACAQNPMANS